MFKADYKSPSNNVATGLKKKIVSLEHLLLKDNVFVETKKVVGKVCEF